MPYEEALIELAYAQFLRRQRRRREATARLSEARARLAELGARPALERCERELAACGHATAPEHDGAGTLTPQERAVARLVASGLGNRRVAEELMVSVRTVETHLTRIYGKLGVTSRAELAARFRD
jgi:DNA-binding NarL/FixJ family response regulator